METLPETKTHQDNQVQEAVGTLINVLESHLAEEKKKREDELALPSLIRNLHAGDGKGRTNLHRVMEMGPLAIPALREALKHPSEQVRMAAATVLQQIDDAQAHEALRELLYQELQAVAVQRKRWMFGRGVRVALLVALVIIGIIKNFNFWFFWMILGGSGFVDKTAKMRLKSIEALSKTTDVRMIGVLALCLKDKSLRHTATKILIKLLPSVQTSDKQYITPQEREALLQAFRWSDPWYKIAVLKALEQIGGEKEIPFVVSIQYDSEIEEVYKAADACLPFLRLRAEQEQLAHTLLRASSANNTMASETLLRPAQGVSPVDASQLLRAQYSPEGEGEQPIEQTLRNHG